ncbi:MAG TPA: ABC transporter permease [Pararobbsia sp.]|nr:ABC transporter permease [Pararobbsia sp.]
MHDPTELLNPASLENLYREFSANTTGQHSASLQLIINWLRSDAMQGKLALLCTRPHQEWELIRMNGRGSPITRLGEVFHDIDDAERAIFRRRIKERVGYSITGV